MPHPDCPTELQEMSQEGLRGGLHGFLPPMPPSSSEVWGKLLHLSKPQCFILKEEIIIVPTYVMTFKGSDAYKAHNKLSLNSGDNYTLKYLNFASPLAHPVLDSKRQITEMHTYLMSRL